MDPSLAELFDMLHRRFDEFEAWWDRRFLVPRPAPEQRLLHIGAPSQIDAGVVADNWGGLFERAPLPEEGIFDSTTTISASAPSMKELQGAAVIADNWGGMFDLPTHASEERSLNLSAVDDFRGSASSIQICISEVEAEPVLPLRFGPSHVEYALPVKPVAPTWSSPHRASRPGSTIDPRQKPGFFTKERTSREGEIPFIDLAAPPHPTDGNERDREMGHDTLAELNLRDLRTRPTSPRFPAFVPASDKVLEVEEVDEVLKAVIAESSADNWGGEFEAPSCIMEERDFEQHASNDAASPPLVGEQLVLDAAATEENKPKAVPLQIQERGKLEKVEADEKVLPSTGIEALRVSISTLASDPLAQRAHDFLMGGLSALRSPRLHRQRRVPPRSPPLCRLWRRCHQLRHQRHLPRPPWLLQLRRTPPRWLRLRRRARARPRTQAPRVRLRHHQRRAAHAREVAERVREPVPRRAEEHVEEYKLCIGNCLLRPLPDAGAAMAATSVLSVLEVAHNIKEADSAKALVDFTTPASPCSSPTRCSTLGRSHDAHVVVSGEKLGRPRSSSSTSIRPRDLHHLPQPLEFREVNKLCIRSSTHRPILDADNAITGYDVARKCDSSDLCLVRVHGAYFAALQKLASQPPGATMAEVSARVLISRAPVVTRGVSGGMCVLRALVPVNVVFTTGEKPSARVCLDSTGVVRAAELSITEGCLLQFNAVSIDYASTHVIELIGNILVQPTALCDIKARYCATSGQFVIECKARQDADLVFDTMPKRYNSVVYPPHCNGVVLFGHVSVVQEAREVFEELAKLLSEILWPPPMHMSNQLVLYWKHRQWPPPTELQLVSFDTGLRPLPRSSFNMVERCSVRCFCDRLWKPPWPIQICQEIRVTLPPAWCQCEVVVTDHSISNISCCVFDQGDLHTCLDQHYIASKYALQLSIDGGFIQSLRYMSGVTYKSLWLLVFFQHISNCHWPSTAHTYELLMFDITWEEDRVLPLPPLKIWHDFVVHSVGLDYGPSVVPSSRVPLAWDPGGLEQIIYSWNLFIAPFEWCLAISHELVSSNQWACKYSAKFLELPWLFCWNYRLSHTSTYNMMATTSIISVDCKIQKGVSGTHVWCHDGLLFNIRDLQVPWDPGGTTMSLSAWGQAEAGGGNVRYHFIPRCGIMLLALGTDQHFREASCCSFKQRECQSRTERQIKLNKDVSLSSLECTSLFLRL